MRARLKKKLRKADMVFSHNSNYTPREVMQSLHWWKTYLRKSPRLYKNYKRLKKEKLF